MSRLCGQSGQVEPTEITAGSLHLRPFRPWDAPEVLAACQDPEIPRWTSVASPYTAEDARGFVEEFAPQGWAEGTAATFAVLDATTAQLLGAVDLHGIADGSAEVGYWTAPWARGRGATAEAVGAVCRWGFGALGLQRVEWRAGVGNWGSRAVAERCGFTVEGRLRLAHLRADGTRSDDWYGSLLPTDEAVDRRAFGSWRDRSGEGLLLRRWRDDEADAAALLEGCSDPETARWVPMPAPYTADTARWQLREEFPRQWAEGVAALLAAEQDGRVVGCAVLMPATARSAPEAGWWTLPGERGRGVATRVAGLLADWAAELGHTRVEARVDVDNPASSRAAEGAGYQREGVLRASRPDREGRLKDFVLHARLLPGRPIR